MKPPEETISDPSMPLFDSACVVDSAGYGTVVPSVTGIVVVNMAVVVLVDVTEDQAESFDTSV